MKNFKILTAVLGLVALLALGCGDNQNPLDSSNSTHLSPPDLSLISLPPGAVLNSATLGLYVDEFQGVTTHHIDIHRVTAPWDEHTVTYNSFAGSYDPAVEASINALGTGWYTANITSLVQGWLAGDYPDYGIFIEQQEPDWTRYASSEYADIAYHPWLELCYTVDGSPECITIQRGTEGEVSDATIFETYPDENLGDLPNLYTRRLYGLDKHSLIKFDVEVEPPPPGDSQLTPTGTECEDFLDGTAQDLIMTVNPRGRIAPGGFFLFSRIQDTGDVTAEVSRTVDPSGEPLPIFEDAKAYIVDDAGMCQNISNREGVSISYSGGVVTIFVPSYWMNLSYDNILVTKVHYSPPTGQAGTEFCFQTTVNGSPFSEECVTVIAQ